MRSTSTGTYGGSEYFFFTPSPTAKKLFYYLDVSGHIFSNENYRIVRETYNDYLLMYVVRGELYATNEGIDYTVLPNQAVLMNCHVPHVYGSHMETEFYFIHFDGKNFSELYKYIKKNIGVVITAVDNSQILDPLKMIYMQSKYNTHVSEAEAAGTIYKLLCNLIFMKSEVMIRNEPGNRIINSTVDFIEKHLDEDISLQQLAAQANMSPFHFARIFKRYTLQSPHEFLILARLDKAKYLLSTTDFPISEFASQVGYNSDTGFINAFTNRVGVSPGKFRANHPV